MLVRFSPLGITAIGLLAPLILAWLLKAQRRPHMRLG